MISMLSTGPSLQVKIAMDGSNEEKLIGFATKLNYTVNNGQKMIFTVDSPFPTEIAQGASQSYVRGSMTLYMPRGQTLEDLNMSPHRQDAKGHAVGPYSKYFHIKVYDRLTNTLLLSLDFCKIGSYSVDIAARSVVTAMVSFEGMLASPGNSNA